MRADKPDLPYVPAFAQGRSDGGRDDQDSLFADRLRLAGRSELHQTVCFWDWHVGRRRAIFELSEPGGERSDFGLQCLDGDE